MSDLASILAPAREIGLTWADPVEGVRSLVGWFLTQHRALVVERGLNDELRAKLTAREDTPAWRPMSEAPKSGVRVLVTERDDYPLLDPTIARVHVGGAYRDDAGRLVTPVAWMPLPDPLRPEVSRG
jgi:hypothetical protein